MNSRITASLPVLHNSFIDQQAHTWCTSFELTFNMIQGVKMNSIQLEIAGKFKTNSEEV